MIASMVGFLKTGNSNMKDSNINNNNNNTNMKNLKPSFKSGMTFCTTNKPYFCYSLEIQIQ